MRDKLTGAVVNVMNEQSKVGAGTMMEEELAAMSVAALQRLLPLSLLVMESGAGAAHPAAWVHVPKAGGTRLKKDATTGAESLEVKVSRDGEPKGHYIAWSELTPRLLMICWGILSQGGHDGCNADGLTVAGAPVRLYPVESAGVELTQLRVVSVGVVDPTTAVPVTVETALDVLQAGTGAAATADASTTMLTREVMGVGEKDDDDSVEAAAVSQIMGLGAPERTSARDLAELIVALAHGGLAPTTGEALAAQLADHAVRIKSGSTPTDRADLDGALRDLMRFLRVTLVTLGVTGARAVAARAKDMVTAGMPNVGPAAIGFLAYERLTADEIQATAAAAATATAVATAGAGTTTLGAASSAGAAAAIATPPPRAVTLGAATVHTPPTALPGLLRGGLAQPFSELVPVVAAGAQPAKLVVSQLAAALSPSSAVV